MNTKIKKLLFYKTRNSRITTKKLSQTVKSSQQSCSYTLNQLEKKNLIKRYTILIDAVKLGYTNVMVGFNLLDFSSRKDILNSLILNPSVISVEENRQGIDILAEFSSQNLSSFNKTLTDIIYKNEKNITVKFVFPVIVKHHYLKNYLMRTMEDRDTILSGDRDIVFLSDIEKEILDELKKDPSSSLLNISKETKHAIKTISENIKNLERKKVIRGYSAVLNNSRLGINRYHLLLKFKSGGVKDIERFTEFARQNKNIVELSKVIGEFHMITTIEELKDVGLVNEIRSSFPIEDYFIIVSESVHKKDYLPQ